MQTHHRVLFQNAAELAALPGGSVDLVVTSPPYPMIEMWDDSFVRQDERIAALLAAGDGPGASERMHAVLDTVWAECARVVRSGGFLCINIGDATRTVGGGFRLYTNHSRITSSCEALGFQSLPAILWRKQTNAPNKFMGSGMLPSGAYVTLEHEYILVLRKGGKRSFAGAERDRRRRSAFFWEERNTWFSDLWDFKGTRQRMGTQEARARSGAFPFELAFRLISMYSLQEDLVVDPFLGTGTTMLAAMASGRNSTSLEIDSGLRETIEQNVGLAASILNDRTYRRANEHDAFVAQYTADRGHPPKHTNQPHGVPVVTGQEVDLALPVVAGVPRLDDTSGDELAYTVEHDLLSWPAAGAPVAPTPRTPPHPQSPRDDQFDLFSEG